MAVEDDTKRKAGQKRSFLPDLPGEMAKRFCSYDWASTPLGHIDSWPQSLKTAIQLMLASRQPVFVAWGEELTSLYNDGYIPILGAKHPQALGRPFAEVWSDVSDEINSLVEATMAGKAQYFVDFPAALMGRPDRPLGWFTFSWTPLYDDAGDVAGFYCVATETTERVEAEEHRKLLMAELDHRVKNVMAIVQAIARQSLRGVDRDAMEGFIGRLSALAKSHTLLADERWQGASLRRLISEAVSLYRRRDGSRFIFDGPEIRVTAKAAESLMLVFHELVTNAVKYGALSTSGGRISVDWKLQGGNGDQRLVIVWQEAGGPPIEAPPTRKGFGSSLIERSLAHELGGKAELDYRASGLLASLFLPLAAVTDDSARRHP